MANRKEANIIPTFAEELLTDFSALDADLLRVYAGDTHHYLDPRLIEVEEELSNQLLVDSYMAVALSRLGGAS